MYLQNLLNELEKYSPFILKKIFDMYLKNVCRMYKNVHGIFKKCPTSIYKNIQHYSEKGQHVLKIYI